jgi:hypothetical protein
MVSLAPAARVVMGGIDTHKKIHVAAVLGTNGAILGTEQFATLLTGYSAPNRVRLRPAAT